MSGGAGSSAPSAPQPLVDSPGCSEERDRGTGVIAAPADCSLQRR